MPVGSVLELYTSVLGWNLYGAIWSMLVSTGIVLIPFITTVINTLLETRESNFEISSDGLLNILEVRIYSMIVVVFFAAQPMIFVQMSKTSYSYTHCEVTASGVLEKTSSEKSFGDSGSTYDKSTGTFTTMLDGRTPQAPLWWYLVGKLNQAITQAAKQELPCQADLRTMVSGLAELDIPDRQLKDELGDFYNACWQPAVNQFGRERLPDTELPAKYKEGAVYEDINWPGSDFFINRPGYYDTLRASKELSPEHFPYKESRDAVKMPAPPSGTEMGGYPTCSEWWLGYGPDDAISNEEHGLRQRLLKNLKENGASDDCGDCTGSWWKLWSDDKFSSGNDRDNTLIKTALFNTKSSMELNLGNGTAGGGGDLSSDLVSSVKTGFAAVGMTFGSVPDAIETEAYRKIAPALQAITLLAFTVFLPLMLILGTFSLGYLLALTIMQFTLIFWGFLFALAAWLDNFLLSGLFSYGDDGRTMLGMILPDAIHNPDTMAMSWVVRMCYFILPLAFSFFLGVIGHAAGKGITAAMNSAGTSAALKSYKNIPKL